MMRKSFAVLAVAAGFLSADRAVAQEHLVTPDAAQARLSAAAAERQRDLDAIDRALSTPQAASAASTLGADVERLKEALPTLSDRELRDLAARAAALQGDPLAGLDQDIKLLLMIFLIVAIVVLLLQAVD